MQGASRGYTQPGRHPHHAFVVAITKSGERRVGKLAKRGGDEPGKHGLFDQAFHGPPL